MLAQRAQLTAQQRDLVARATDIEHLTLLVAKLERLHCGQQSEKLHRDLDQFELRLEDLEAARASSPQAEQAITLAPEKRQPVRRPLPAHLPRETRTHTPDTAVWLDCGGTLRHLGEDVAEVLDDVPARFRVIRHVRPKLSCACCSKVVQAPAPERPLARGLAGAGLLAHVLMAKYGDHTPLYRQADIFARAGGELDRSMLADWVGGASRLLAPLGAALHQYVIASGKLHADDTPVPVLAPGRGRTKTRRLWASVRDDRPAGSTEPPALWFADTPDCQGEHLDQHLAGFTGTLQADGCAGFGHW